MIAELLWIDGRNGRLKYWIVGFLNLIAILLVGGKAIFAAFALAMAGTAAGFQVIDPITGFALSACWWVGFCNTTRRYHDRDKSGWWALMAVIPLIGAVWQFVELGFLAGTDGDNSYGPPSSGGSSLSGIQEDVEASAPQRGGLAKVDDAYLANYARKLAEESTPAQPAATFTTATPAFPGGTFGKRR